LHGIWGRRTNRDKFLAPRKRSGDPAASLFGAPAHVGRDAVKALYRHSRLDARQRRFSPRRPPVTHASWTAARKLPARFCRSRKHVQDRHRQQTETTSRAAPRGCTPKCSRAARSWGEGEARRPRRLIDKTSGSNGARYSKEAPSFGGVRAMHLTSSCHGQAEVRYGISGKPVALPRYESRSLNGTEKNEMQLEQMRKCAR